MKVEPSEEHKWLHQLIGEWKFESECIVGPDEDPIKSNGRETVRSLGGLWTIGEGVGQSPEGEGEHSMIMTLGYDPLQKRFVGSFIVSIMTHLWLYNGTLDASKNILTLDTEGPSFNDPKALTRYQDIIEIVSKTERTLSSRLLGEDGKWTPFMKATYVRV